MNYKLDMSITATLVAPRIPVVDRPDKGGLGVAELRKNPPEDVIVTAPLLASVPVGSTIVLFWSGMAADSYVLTEQQQATGLITFNVLPGQIADANQAELIYQIFSPVGGNPAVSAPYYVRVNTKVPGSPPLNPVEPINQNLAPPGGIPTPITDAIAANGINVIIAPWTNMEVGDVLTLTWGQSKIVRPPLTAGELNRPVTVPVSQAIILATSNTLDLKVFYDIRDNVGNWSLNSLPATTDVEAGPNTLPSPRIQEALGDDDLALGELGAQNAHVLIPAYTPWNVGDRVNLFWSGLTAGGIEVNQTKAYTMLADDEGFPVTLEIDNATVVAIAGGRAIVYYEVNGTSRSRRKAITVSGAVQQLPAPSVVQAQGGELDPANVTAAGATVLVKWSPGMTPGDRVYLYWNGTTAAGGDTHFTADQPVIAAGQNLLFTVPKAEQVIPLAGGKLDLYYVVVSGGGQRESDHSSLTVKAVANQQPPALDVLEDNEATHVLDISNLTVVTARVPNYGMLAGDMVQVRWAGITQHDTAVQTVAAIGPMNFNLPLAWATENVDQPAGVNLTYSYGRGANPVVTSQPLHITVTRQQVPLDLIEPSVDQAVNDEIDFHQLANGVATVRVNYPGMAVGHTVRVRWRGRIEYFTDTRPVTAVGPLLFDIPRDEVIDVIGSTVDVNYSVVVTPGAPIQASKIYQLSVKRQPLNLVAPTINGTRDNVRVDYPGSLTSHTIVVRWLGVTEHSTAIKHPEQNGYYVNFSIPATWVSENRGRTVLVNYSVGVGNNPLIFSQILRVDVP